MLLSREKFEAEVFKRDSYTCVFCKNKAVDAHHIFERKLFKDGGYYVDNGASVCASHHWDCETTSISLDQVWRACGISNPLYPEGFDKSNVYDKWGNLIRADGLREPGPLFDDTGCRRALVQGKVLGLFVPKGTSG